MLEEDSFTEHHLLCHCQPVEKPPDRCLLGRERTRLMVFRVMWYVVGIRACKWTWHQTDINHNLDVVFLLNTESCCGEIHRNTFWWLPITLHALGYNIQSVCFADILNCAIFFIYLFFLFQSSLCSAGATGSSPYFQVSHHWFHIRG